ncbi:MAG: hypothetical protein ACTSX6_00380 [Candidatus Heimdallarchaeaceae archaeon]
MKKEEVELLPPEVPYEKWGPYVRQMAVLKKIRDVIINQYKHRSRNDPLPGDIDIYDNASVTIPAGSVGTVSFTVPLDYVFYFPKVGMTFYQNTRYKLYIDGVLIHDTPYDIQGISEHSRVFEPPKEVKSKVLFSITNGDSVQHTYWVYVSGWLRSKGKVREIGD